MPVQGSTVTANDPGILAKEAESATMLEFNRRLENQSPIIAGLLDVKDSEGTDEDYATVTSMPLPRIWAKGEARSWDSFDDVNVNVVNRKWQLGIPWNREDREDDRTGDVIRMAQAAGRRMGDIDERVALQIILGSTDIDLLPSIPNAYDGTALVSAAARFGNANGNTLTGSGVATVNAIVDDLFLAQERYLSFQDTKGEPYFLPEDVIFSNMRIIAGASNLQVFTQAFTSDKIPAGVLTSTSNASTNNPFLVDGADMRSIAYFTPRITDNDWFIYLDVPFAKALIKQNRTPLESKLINSGNSDWADDHDKEGITFRMRRGYGVGAPQIFLKMNN